MRLNWLILACLSVFLGSQPADAAQILFWRFNAKENRLDFKTDLGVQPKAEMMLNPTRLIVDLPGTTLARPTVTEKIEGDSKIYSLRVGQLDDNTVRLVIELKPGYTVNPEKVVVKGENPTRWWMQLPTPYLQKN